MNTRNRRLRPLGIADILDETADLYKTNFALLVGVAAVLYVPIFLISGLLQDPTPTQSANTVSMIFAIVMLAAEAVVTGALTYGISERYLGRETSIAACYRRIVQPGVLWPFIGIILLKNLITVGPLQALAFVAPSFTPGSMSKPTEITTAIAVAALMGFVMIVFVVWFLITSIKLLLLEPAFVIEGNGGFKSMKRSLSLTRGFFWKICGLLLIAGIVIGLVFLIVVGPAYGVYMSKVIRGEDVSRAVLILPSIVMTIVGTLIVPIPAILAILVYYDIRIRKEGFDLELLANELDQWARALSGRDITDLPREQNSSSDNQP